MNDSITKQISIARSAYYSLGTRLWFVLQDNEGNRYQRWSFDMDSTDECLMLIQPKDIVNITYCPQYFYATGTLQKNVLTTVEFQ